MKRALVLPLVLCSALASASPIEAGQSGGEFRLAEALLSANETGSVSTQASSSGQESKSAAKQKEKPKPPPEPETNAPISASMVGYIDNAIVGSEVRIRFDAAFNDQFPDRAEFIYGKCGCYRNNNNGVVADPNAPGPGAFNPTGVPKNVNFQVLSFMGEYAPNRRFSGFVEIPFRWLQPQGSLPDSTVAAFPNGAGISDVQAGLKFALLASPSRYLTAQLKTYFPSGYARNGLGTNHFSLEPALLYYQRFSQRWEVEGELGGWLPIGGSSGAGTGISSGFAGNIFYYGIGPSYRVVDHEQFKLAPVIELVGWSVTGGFQTGPSSAGGTNIVNLKLGARMSFRAHNSLYVGYGHALTSADWYNNILRVEYRRAF